MSAGAASPLERRAPAAPWVDRLRSTLWPNLPTLLVSSAAVSAAAAIVMVLTPGITPISILLWALLVAPVFGALVAQANDIVLGAEVACFSIPAYLRRTGRLGLTVVTPAALSGSCCLVAIAIWEQTHRTVVLASVAAGAVCCALLTLAAIAALPIGLEREDLRGIPLMLTALHVAARRPVPVFAVAAFLVAAVSAAVQIAASLVLLVPGPLALVLVVAVWTSAEASGIRPRLLDD